VVILWWVVVACFVLVEGSGLFVAFIASLWVAAVFACCVAGFALLVVGEKL